MEADRYITTRRLAARIMEGDGEAVRELCSHLGIAWYDKLFAPKLPSEILNKLDVGWARKNRAIPILVEDDVVTVAVPNPLAASSSDEIAFALGRRVETVCAPVDEILRTLNLLFTESLSATDDLLKEMAEDQSEGFGSDFDTETDLIDSSEAAPVIRLVNRILYQAANEGVSDVHIEPAEGEVKVRYRIDGVLYDRINPPKNYLPFLSSRIKVMSGLDIAERRLPQDGRFKFTVAEKNIDVRVSVIPTAGGERLVLRLLDKTTALFGLEDLGMDQDNLEIFQRLIASPHGIILATGPTGSGKTTSLYAALTQLDNRELNIITIEDPVEYQLPGVGQIQVNTKAGLTFAGGLRSVLRHDPDVIMIGEIRDLETAEIAIQSSLTGHLVFSTLHTNDAPSAVTRLVDMGVEPYLVSSSVIGVIAQRLIRVLCPHCKQSDKPSPEALERAGLRPDVLDGAEVFRPRGCEHCFNTGYRGRTGIYELMPASDELHQALSRTSEAGELRRAAISAGLKTLMDSGLSKVRRGQTSLEEVLRVTLT